MRDEETSREGETVWNEREERRGEGEKSVVTRKNGQTIYSEEIGR